MAIESLYTSVAALADTIQGTADTTLTNGITSGATAFVAAVPTGLSTGPCVVRIGSELIRVDSIGGTTWALSASGRGVEGSAAAAHSSGDKVYVPWTGAQLDRWLTDHPPAFSALTGHGNWKLIYTNGSGVETELALGAAGTVLQSNGASSAPTFIYPPLSSTTSTPSGNVGLTLASTWYDICSVSCAAGTWLLVAQFNGVGGASATYVAKIYDATTPSPNTPVTMPAGAPLSGANCTIPLVAIVSPSGTTTYTLAGLSTVTGCTATKTNSIASASGPACYLSAVRLA